MDDPQEEQHQRDHADEANHFCRLRKESTSEEVNFERGRLGKESTTEGVDFAGSRLRTNARLRSVISENRHSEGIFRAALSRSTFNRTTRKSTPERRTRNPTLKAGIRLALVWHTNPNRVDFRLGVGDAPPEEVVRDPQKHDARHASADSDLVSGHAAFQDAAWIVFVVFYLRVSREVFITPGTPGMA